MLSSLSHSFMYVLDHDEALEFYAGKLGLEVGADVDLGPFRWVTVHVPGKPESAIVLSTPDMGHDEETAAAIRDLVVKGGGNGVIFNVADCRAPMSSCARRASSSRRSRRSTSTASIAGCATRSATRCASRSRRPSR
jgi:hypothetical protein